MNLEESKAMIVKDFDDLSRHPSTTPVFDAAALRAIGDQLRDPTAARRFAGVYLDKLDGRISRLCAALERGDGEDAMDAALSLKVSSASAGTRELERMAASLETLLRGNQLAKARRVGRHLPAAGARGRDALRAHLDV